MPTPTTPTEWMLHALSLAEENVEAGRGGPFAALVVRDHTLIATGTNRVTTANDPTAHAEVSAIRAACATLGVYHLDGCDLYTTCEPCPMCLSAIYWAHLDRIFYAATRHDAADAGFDDAFLYDELAQPLDARKVPVVRVAEGDAGRPFDRWEQKTDRTPY